MTPTPVPLSLPLETHLGGSLLGDSLLSSTKDHGGGTEGGGRADKEGRHKKLHGD